MSIDIDEWERLAIECKAWQDNGYTVTDEYDTYPNDLFDASTTPVDILELINRLRDAEKERDELKARIDGGVRVYAAKYPRNDFEIHAESMAVYPQNATLIIDDEVEL